MANSIKARLKKYATLSYLHELITDPAKVGTASRVAAGLMSPDHVRKLERIEDNATGDMKGDEIVLALDKVAAPLPLDVEKLDGKSAADFAGANHTHDDRYMRTEHVREALVALSKELGTFMHEVGTNFSYLADAIKLVAEATEKCLTIAAFERAIKNVDAVKIGGKSLEDLDRRYARTELVSAFVPQRAAHSGGVVKGGQYSPDPSKGPLFRYTNGGNHVFALPASKNDYELKVAVTHGKDAGRITFADDLHAALFGEHHVGTTDLIIVTKIGSYIDIEVR
jgi:hypothetical protein